MRRQFELGESDHSAIAQLKGFIPPRVFDAHTHMHLAAANPNAIGDTFVGERGTYAGYVGDMAAFLPGMRELRLNMMPMPDTAMNGDRDLRARANAHILSQLDLCPGCVGAPYIMAGDGDADIRAMVAHPGIRALKCYCYSSGFGDFERCNIADFLPENSWRVANELGLVIVLHMMRPGALSDAENLQYILDRTARYPNAKLLLAHCARGFASWTVVDSIRKLPDRDNIWFDFSAICESAPMAACILQTAAKRVVWGSDYPIVLRRGKAVSVSTGFAWATGEAADALASPSGAPCRMIAENLLALRQACMLLNLDATQVQDIFFDNAMRLFEPT